MKANDQRNVSNVPLLDRTSHAHWTSISKITLVFVISIASSYVNAQSAFNTTNFNMLNWDEGTPTIAQLANLNDETTDALDTRVDRSDFCFMLETEPADILKFSSAQTNCSTEGSAINNGFRPSTSATKFGLEAGSRKFDYESRVQHRLKITAFDENHNPPLKSNSLTVTFELADVDEAPFWVNDELVESRYFRVGDRFQYNLNNLVKDPEGLAVSFELSSIRLCEAPGVNVRVNTGSMSPDCLTTANGAISGKYISIQPRGPLLYNTVHGTNISAAGVYNAYLFFNVLDPGGNSVANRSEIQVRIKHGANNPPTFKGGATGFSVTVDESTLTPSPSVAISPNVAGDWNAEDLDNDSINYILLGQKRLDLGQDYCLFGTAEAIRVGKMCIRVTAARGNVYLVGRYLDYEDPVLSPSGSVTVTLRASDGWDPVDIPITVTLNDVNELYFHSNRETEKVLPLNVSIVEGESITFNLSDYVTDPENDALTYTAYAHVYSGLVNVSAGTLTITGTGTNANNPTLSDRITVEVTDGQLTEMRDISVRVRNTNEPPSWEPSGVLRVAGSIDENAPPGTLVDGLVQYSDSDSPADELEVIVDSTVFEGVVDPLIEDGVLCQVASATCVAQTGYVALVTKTELDHESQAQHDVKLGLHDGWERSNAAQDVTIEITVNDLNDPPATVGRVPNQSLSVQGTETFDASLYFSDEDVGDRLLVTATSRDTKIASVSVAGAADVTVTGEGIGTARIELTATDTSGSIATQLFDVVVAANRPPVAQSQVFADRLPENSEMLEGDIVDVSLIGLFIDPDGDSIEVEVESLDDAVLLVSPSSDGSTVTLVARALGTSDLIFTATDSASNVTAEIHSIDVVSQLSATNEPPILDQAALEAALPENNTMVEGNFHDMMFAGIFSDPEGGSLLVKVSTSDVNVLEVAASDATDTVTLFAISEGSADLTIAATDDGDLTTETVVTIKVIADTTVVDNQAPVLDSDAFSTALPPDRSIVLRRFFNMDLTGLFTDPDGDSITLSAESSDSSVLRVSMRQNGTAAFLLARTVGSADLIITATDSEGNETEARATINVIEETDNRSPTIDRDALTAALPANNTMSEGEFFELQLDSLFSDPDGDDDIAALEGSSSNNDVLDVSVDDNHLLTALALSPGDAVLSLVARDNAGAETKVDETIRVVAASAASLAISAQSFDRSAPLTLDLGEFTRGSATRRALQNLSSSVGDDSILSTSLDGSTLTLHALNKGRTFVKLANYGNDETAIRSMFYVDVVNAAPSLVAPLGNQTATRISGLSIDLTGIFEDADGEAFKITAKSHDDAIASVALESRTLSIQGIQVGETTVTLIATDTNGAATEVSFKVTVENVAPTVQAHVGPIQLQVGGEPYELAFTEIFSDDGDTLTYAAVLNAQGVVHSYATDTGVTFSPLAKGNTSLSVTATDPYGGVASFSTDIVVGDERLKEVAAASLAGFGRAMLSSVSSAIDSRATMDRGNSDLSNDSWRPVSLEELMDKRRSTSHVYDLPWTESDSPFAPSSHFEVAGGNGLRQTSSMSSSPINGGVSFDLGSDETPSPWSIWSNMDRQAYAGDGYEGTLVNGHLGIDKAIGDKWIVGIAATQHRGESTYVYGTATQRLDIGLKQLMPYARFTPSDNTAVWGTVGLGSGELGTTVTGRDYIASDLTSGLAMLSARHGFLNLNQSDLALRGDFAAASLQTPAGDAASDGLVADVHRARVGVEGSYTIDCIANMMVMPFGQVNLRTDGGDGNTGSGLEFTGGLKIAFSAVSLEWTGRVFDIYGQQPYNERGMSMTAKVNPSMDGSGFSATISPRWGADASLNGELWNDFSDSLSNPYSAVRSPGQLRNGSVQLDTNFGYGILMSNERFLLTPFVQFGRTGDERQQTQIGAQLSQVNRARASISSRVGIGQVRSLTRDTETAVQASVQLSF